MDRSSKPWRALREPIVKNIRATFMLVKEKSVALMKRTLNAAGGNSTNIRRQEVENPLQPSAGDGDEPPGFIEGDQRSPCRSKECQRRSQKRPVGTISKILIPCSLAAIMTAPVIPVIHEKYHRSVCYSWIPVFVAVIQWVAALLMTVGLYLVDRHRTISEWFQVFGHLLCLEGILVMQAPVVKLPPHYLFGPMLFIAVVLVVAFIFS